MGDWIVEHLGWIALGLGALLVGLMALAIYAEVLSYSTFMEGCMKERAEYECTAMWRGAQTQVVPVMIPVR
jgi:hypothetical protein